MEVHKRQWMQGMLSSVRSLRDEIRVEMHLAGMEAKTRWKEKLEPRLHGAEKFGSDVRDVSGRAMKDLVEKYRHFRESLHRSRPS
jgi:hypothetical protein